MKNNILINHADAFRCPLCGEAFAAKEQSFLCQKGHCFDVSSKGYVNFLTNPKRQPYEKFLFESRGRIFDSGFYDRAAEAVQNILTAYSSDTVCRFLDAGCGEGFYASFLTRDSQMDGFGLDVVKEAVILAAKRSKNVKWMVADLAKIPLRNDSMNAVLNILTPANYREFQRVLSPQGILIKVVPGEDYLKEIRSAVSGQLNGSRYKGGDIISHFKKYAEILEIQKSSATFSLTPEQRIDFLKMTPMTFHADIQKAADFSEITVDLDILVGRMKNV